METHSSTSEDLNFEKYFFSLQHNGVTGQLGASVLSWLTSVALHRVTKGVARMKNKLIVKTIGYGVLSTTAVLLEGHEYVGRENRCLSRRPVTLSKSNTRGATP